VYERSRGSEVVGSHPSLSPRSPLHTIEGRSVMGVKHPGEPHHTGGEGSGSGKTQENIKQPEGGAKKTNEN